jgi:hypothetical protein
MRVIRSLSIYYIYKVKARTGRSLYLYNVPVGAILRMLSRAR